MNRLRPKKTGKRILKEFKGGNNLLKEGRNSQRTKRRGKSMLGRTRIMREIWGHQHGSQQETLENSELAPWTKRKSVVFS